MTDDASDEPPADSAGDEGNDATDEAPDVSMDEFYETLHDSDRPVVTASDVARLLDCSQAGAAAALDDLVDAGRVQSLDVEADPTVYFASDYKEAAEGQRVVLFPKRQQIVLDRPSQFTRAQLSQFAHLEDTNGEEGYIYEVRQEDVWAAPHDNFEALRTTMRDAVGQRSEPLEDWVRSQWERARKFRLYTHEEGYTVLEAQSADLMGNVAEQKLDEGQLRARISDTEAWVAGEHVAAVKRALYDAGYPVQDHRDLETGEPLAMDLELTLRDYQGQWVTRFLERKAGILVGPPGSGKTVAALGIMSAIEGETLILVPGRELAGQWRDQVLRHTTLEPEQVGEYHGGEKNVRPVTIATYQTAGMDRHRMLFDDRKWGLIVYDECLSGDTVVETPDGRTTFAELDEEIEFDLGWNPGIDSPVRTFVPGEGYEWTEVTGVYKTHTTIQRIQTNVGHTLRATPSHTHLVFDPDTCTISEQNGVSEGDHLVLPTPDPPEALPSGDGEDQRSTAIAELTGWFIGDGHLNEYGDITFSFSQRTAEQIQILSNLCETLDVSFSVFESARGDRTLHAPKLQDVIGWDGEGGAKTASVSIPAESYSWDHPQIGALLRGLFDANGFVDKKGRIQINTASQTLAADLSRLLLRFGIVSRRFTIERDDEAHNDVHKLTIAPYYSSLFGEHIGFKLEHKAERLPSGASPATGLPVDRYLEKIKRDTGLTNGGVSNLATVSRQTIGDTIRGHYRLGQRHLHTIATGLENSSERTIEDAVAARENLGVSYSTLAAEMDLSTSAAYNRFCHGGDKGRDETCDIMMERQSEIAKHSERLSALSEIHLVEVTDVEGVGTETVYDFETGSHTFLADGFLTHNCQHIPSPIYRQSADLQTKARVGLSVDGDTVLPIRHEESVRMVPIEDLAMEYLGTACGVSDVTGVETLSVTDEGTVKWTSLDAVMRHEHGEEMYTVRARNGREVTVTADHSLIVFDADEMTICGKRPTDIGEEDYLLQPIAVPSGANTSQEFDVMSTLDEGYVLLEEDTPESIFEPLEKRSIADNKSQYNWKSRRNLPLDVAREIGVKRAHIKGVYVHDRDTYIPPTVSTASLARLIGLFVADGALDGHRVEFYATDSDENSKVAEFESVIHEVCPEAKISKVANGDNCTILRVSGPLVRVLRSIGLSNGARQKTVPEFILSNPAAYEPFLEGVELCNGHRQRRETDREIVTISTSSDELAQGLNFILAALGHVGGNYCREADDGVRAGTHDVTTNNLIRFNPKNRNKQPRLSMAPFTSMRDAHDSIKRFSSDGGPALRAGRKDRSLLNDEEVELHYEHSGLGTSWLSDNDVAMLEVESVTISETRDVVYDISTDEENFLGNHLFCHNSATPVREDDKQAEIFTLIGPPIGTDWEALFDAGYVAEPEVEIRLLPWPSEDHAAEYGSLVGHEKRQFAASNPAKVAEIRAILDEHPGAKALIFVEYIDQGDALAEELGVPFVSGEMPHARRRKHFDEFRNGPRDALVVSRVGDEGIDLPEAEVAIAASGLGGSRRQGAQRAGRTMRPVGKARMYVLATRGTREEDFARDRMRHLAGKGIQVRERDSVAWD